MQVKRDMLSTQVRTLEDKIVNLQSQYSFLESQVNLHSQRLYVYDELNAIGLGLNKLRLLLNTIKEIAAENGISYKDGVDQFFEFIEKHYDIKLRLKKSRTTQLLLDLYHQNILLETLIQLIIIILVISHTIIIILFACQNNNRSNNKIKLHHRYPTIIIMTLYLPLKLDR